MFVNQRIFSKIHNIHHYYSGDILIKSEAYSILIHIPSCIALQSGNGLQDIAHVPSQSSWKFIESQFAQFFQQLGPEVTRIQQHESARYARTHERNGDKTLKRAFYGFSEEPSTHRCDLIPMCVHAAQLFNLL